MPSLMLLLLLSCSSLVTGWLPADKNLFGKNANLDNRSPEKSRRYLPASTNKFRGVNLGSLFVIEPWMAHQEWENMGCGSTLAESECVEALGQEQANKVWNQHWSTWITQDDINQIASYGLNTVRIPIGWWMLEDLVQDGEHFPQKGYPFFHQICGWAAEAGLYVIADLHALPGAQKAAAPFTGTYASSPGFYQDSNYERAYKFLSWLTTEIHNDSDYRTVGMIEVVNEPIPGQESLLTDYYPKALKAIRDAETAAKVKPGEGLTVEFMDELWGVGNALVHVKGDSLSNGASFDDHYYLNEATDVAATQKDFISHTCQKSYDSDNSPLLTGEFSLAEQSNGWQTNLNIDDTTFAKKYFAAQVQAFEKNLGWVFWSWKTDLGEDWQWDYRNAVKAGVVPTYAADALKINACE